MTRREVPLDAIEILRALTGNQVDYVVIGGLAVQAHGHTRTTQDVGIVPAPGPRNRHRLEAALTALESRPVGQQTPNQVPIPVTGVLELDTLAGGVDVHLDPPGAPPYDLLRARALELDLGLGGPVPVAGLDDLIAMKRTSGRPLDRSDILVLTEPGQGS